MSGLIAVKRRGFVPVLKSLIILCFFIDANPTFLLCTQEAITFPRSWRAPPGRIQQTFNSKKDSTQVPASQPETGLGVEKTIVSEQLEDRLARKSEQSASSVKISSLNQFVQYDGDGQSKAIVLEADSLGSLAGSSNTDGQFEDEKRVRNVADATGGQPMGVDNKTLEQLNQLPNKIAELTKNSDTSGEISELNQDFLNLFDELWRIKNSSVTTLVRLEYFQNQTKDNLSDERNSLANKDDMCESQGDCKTNDQSTRYLRNSTSVTSAKGKVNNKLWNKFKPAGQQTKTSSLAISLDWSQAAARLNNWMGALQQRVQTKFTQLCQLLKGGQNRSCWGQKGKTYNVAPSSSASVNVRNKANVNNSRFNDDELTSESNIVEVVELRSGRSRRQVSGDNQPVGLSSSIGDNDYRRQQSLTEAPTVEQNNCINITIDEENQCKSIEASINSHLSQTFPGTLGAIAESCKQITFLLSNCWPQQLSQLKQSLVSWNETLLSNTEYPLPFYPQIDSSNGSQVEVLKVGSSIGEQPTCGSGEPTSPQAIRDRVNWMYLNLCMDKKFRNDYVQNLRCLSTWNQERAQQACTNEYKQMHGYVAHQPDFNPASLSPTSSQSNTRLAWSMALATNGTTSNRLDEAQLESREIGSKMLCCMFDQFLRCVHKQAARDCGRSGAQFVVNFMSRIGTDDMKYLCNGESRYSSTNPAQTPQGLAPASSSNHNAGHSKQHVPAGKLVDASLHRMKLHQSNRKAHYHSDRSPFIEANYCTDSRIQAALQSVNVQFGNPAGSRHSSGSSTVTRTSTGLKNKSRLPINHDPTFYGGDSELSGSSAASPSRAVVDVWMMVQPILLYTVINRMN